MLLKSLLFKGINRYELRCFVLVCCEGPLDVDRQAKGVGLGAYI